jgi:hypothetical protein
MKMMFGFGAGPSAAWSAAVGASSRVVRKIKVSFMIRWLFESGLLGWWVLSDYPPQ